MKKLLCLVLTVVMAFSCFSMCLTASAADYLYRPDGVDDKTGVPIPDEPNLVGLVIDPILFGADTDFAKRIYDMGYKEAENPITASEFEKRIKGYVSSTIFPTDDKMFGVNIDVLYYLDKGAFVWDFCKYKLISNPDIHNKEISQAEANKTKSTCQMKGWYDTCSEVLNGYEYDYLTKSIDKKAFNNIIEMKSTIFNNATQRKEAHYDYYYNFDQGQFSLMRSTANYLVKKVVTGSIGNGKLYATKEIANANAIKISNFIGNLLYSDFHDIPEDTVIFNDTRNMTDKDFFLAIGEQSGLDDILQTSWVKTNKFNVKDIIGAFGYFLADDDILNIELTNSTYMARRLLANIYQGFVNDPLGYIASLIQLFSRNYETLCEEAFKGLFANKFETVVARSREADDSVSSYDGFELSTFDGLINFIEDAIYFNKLDAGEAATNYTFAPLPTMRLSNAKDSDELYLYLLCYFDINRSYLAPITDKDNKVIGHYSNTASINNFIAKTEQFLNANYTSENKAADIANAKTVLEDIFTSTLTLPEIQTFYLTQAAGEVIADFPNNFMSSIKNAIANIINNFMKAMDNFFNLLFGWTDGLFDKTDK